MTPGSLTRCPPTHATRAPIREGADRRFRFCPLARRLGLLLGASLLLAGCGGGLPLLHSAHVLPPGAVRAGAGLSGQIALLAPAAASPATNAANAAKNGAQLEAIAVAPAVAPWVGARIGIQDDNEGGLAYSGRSIRIDGRHAFSLGGAPLPLTLSIGLGASAVTARRLGEPSDGSSVYGGGIDMPVLFGWKSTSDLYSIWLGPRAGIELLKGRLLEDSQNPESLVDVTGRHIFAGFVAGVRVGFRHVHVALELSGAYHRADGSLAGAAVGLNQFTLTPAGALLTTF